MKGAPGDREMVFVLEVACRGSATRLHTIGASLAFLCSLGARTCGEIDQEQHALLDSLEQALQNT